MCYSMENPNSLVLWEAQFGDLANSAQVMSYQFLSNGESKQLQQTGLVVLLPHNYGGQRKWLHIASSHSWALDCLIKEIEMASLMLSQANLLT